MSCPFIQAAGSLPVSALQVNLASGKRLRLPVKGCGLACALMVQPEVLHFGIVPTYQWADQLLQVCNNSAQLPMQLSVVASGPNFTSLPGQLELAPGSSGEVVIRYRPKVRPETLAHSRSSSSGCAGRACLLCLV